jgi:hypothetical protein
VRIRKLNNVSKTLELLSDATDLHGLSQVTLVHGYLDGVGKVEVEIHDSGENDDRRYAIYAKTLDLDVQKTATGNPEPDLDTAIALVHWGDLKR